MAKPDYDTVRDLEKKGYKLFKVAGIIGVVGIIAAVPVPPLGVGFILVAAVIFFYGMLWMMKLQREPVRHLFCPYCASKNDVFMSRNEFDCDICGRRVGVAPNGEPIPLEPVDDEDD